jgi:alkyl sulfatase BDS1-like metallo-beta-lactamase superfamily hydrolase
MDDLNATTLNDYLNAGQRMLRQLSQAELIDEKSVTLNGQSARQLSIKVTPALSEKDKKYIKEIEATAKIWLDADGWPIAAEHSVHLKGRALLVISFEQFEHHEFQYTRANGRLVAVRHAKESNNSGAGESMHSKTLATLAIVKPS